METTTLYEKIRRRAAVTAIIINAVGALATGIFQGLIDPVPTGDEPTVSYALFDFILAISFLTTIMSVGWILSRRAERRINEGYRQLQEGAKPAELPDEVRRAALNASFRAMFLTFGMWLGVGILSSFQPEGRRIFIGTVLVGGVIATTATYFAHDLIWRPIVPIFFPDGDMGKLRTVRLSVLGRLLLVFFLIGIYPPAVLALMTWERAQILVTAANPQIVLDNLLAVQIYLLVAGIVASIFMALMVTRGITRPLDALREAMKRVEQDDLDAQVTVLTNDELGYLGHGFNQMTAGLRQARDLRYLLDLFVSPEVADEALRHGTKLGGQQVDCSVLFSDIRGFTEISEQLAPADLVELVNRYMRAVVAVIVANQGIVNKFGGDSLLAVFGTPLNPATDHAARAVRAALEMQIALVDFNTSQVDRALPRLETGIGVASGPVVAGNIGGRERIEYTVMGDTVNLASRLQDTTKRLQSQILLSQQTFDQAAWHMDLEAKRVANIAIRGKSEPVTAYAPV